MTAKVSPKRLLASRRIGATPAPVSGRRSRLRLWMTPSSGRPVSLLLTLLLAGFLAVALLGNRFAVTEVAVSGAKLTSAADVIDSVALLGVNVFTVDPQTVASRLSGLPAVRRVVVWAELPGQLHVMLWERQGVVLWKTNDERLLVDEDGRVLVVNPDSAQSGDAIEVSAPGAAPPARGERLDPRVIRAAVALSAGLHGLTRPNVTTIDYDAANGLALNLDGGQRVIIGTGDRIPEKLAVLGAVVEASSKWTLLDLRDPDRPYYR